MYKRLNQFMQANYQWIVLISITLISGFLRFYNLGQSSLYHDEALYWQWAVGLSQGERFNIVINNNVFLFLLGNVVTVSQSEFSLGFLVGNSG